VGLFLELNLAYPARDCNHLSYCLKLKGPCISAPKVQEILSTHEMGTRYHRWLKLEGKNSQKEIELTAEQVAFLEKENPCFRERNVESCRPGELLNQDTFFVGHLKGVGEVYLNAVVVSSPPMPSSTLLSNRKQLPFFKERGFQYPPSSQITGRNSAARKPTPIRSTWP